MAPETIARTLKTVPLFMRMKYPHAWFDYDDDADVLYISFERPQQASDSELLPNDVLVRRRGKKVVGLTVMHASRYR